MATIGNPAAFNAKKLERIPSNTASDSFFWFFLETIEINEGVKKGAPLLSVIRTFTSSLMRNLLSSSEPKQMPCTEPVTLLKKQPWLKWKDKFADWHGKTMRNTGCFFCCCFFYSAVHLLILIWIANSISKTPVLVRRALHLAFTLPSLSKTIQHLLFSLHGMSQFKTKLPTSFWAEELSHSN